MIVLPPGYNSGDTVYCYFDTFGTNGESITISGLAVTDIEIYKNGSTTQRASDNGYTLLDTDGTDFDGTTGLHGFSVDTSDNSDSGFWADGNHYLINVNAITVNGQTVRFSYGLLLGYLLRPTTAGRKLDVTSTGGAGIDWSNVENPTTTLNLSGTTTKSVTDRVTANTDQWGGTAVGSTEVRANLINIAGSAVNTASAQIGVNVVNFGGSAGTFSAGRPEVNATHWGGTAVASAVVGANVVQISGDSTAADNAESFFDGTGYAGTNNVIPTVTTVTNGVTVTTNNDKTGYLLASGGLASVTAWTVNITGTLSGNVGGVATGGISRSSFAADTGLQSVRSNTAQAGGATSITLDASASAVDDFYNNTLVFLTGGTGAGQSRFITDYVGSTKVATVGTWATNPDNTTTFAILSFDTVTSSAPTAAQNAVALLDYTDGIETGITPRGALRLISASTVGKLSGAAGTTITIRNVGDSKDRIVATVDVDGNRTAVTTDAT